MRNIFFIMPAMSGGGAERVTSVLANHFVEQADVTFFLVEKNVVEYDLDPRIHIDTSAIKGKTGISKRLQKLVDIRKLMKENPDAVFISFLSNENLFTALAATGLNVRVILSERNDPYQTIGNGLKKVITNWLYGKKQCKVVVFQTDGARGFYSKKIQRKGVIIFNPLKADLPEHFIGERRKSIVSLARLEPQKNYPMLLKAFQMFHSSHAEYTLDIYGKGPEEESLKKLTSALGIDSYVNFHGFQNDVHTKICDASMFVLSSDYEGLSNAMIEAMAIGLPCVCTDCSPGGARMMIQTAVNGILVPVNDASAMEMAMSQIAEDSAFAEKLSQNAVRVRTDLSVDVIAKKWKELIANI